MMNDYEKLQQEIHVLKAQLVDAEIYINELKSTLSAIQALVEPPLNYDTDPIEEDEELDNSWDDDDYEYGDCD